MSTEQQILTLGQVAEIEARYKVATPGPWAVWDSCSWRRIGTVEPFREGNVICPITQNDGHPDLLAKREDLEFVAHAREDVPALCQTVRALRAESADWEKQARLNQKAYGETLARLSEVEKERDELRDQIAELRPMT